MKKTITILSVLLLVIITAAGQERTLRLTDKDRSKDILTLIQGLQPFQLRGNNIFFNGDFNSIYFPQGALIIIDGNKTGDDVGNLTSLNVAEIESITVMTKPADYAIYTSMNVNGVIVVKTKRGITNKQ